MEDKSKELQNILEKANCVVIIQADNPDADSLASSLALESILADKGKSVFMYCSVDMPEHLRYLKGWDRVAKDMPSKFDASIIVDTSASSLLEKLDSSAFKPWVASKPVIVLDHHKGVICDIDYANLVINNPSKVSTGELIYSLFDKSSISIEAGEFIMSSILADSLGLATENTTAQTYRVMAELVEMGVNRPKLEEIRRYLSKMPEMIFRYKSKLIQETKFYADGRVAVVVIGQDDINQFSPLYNPNALIQNEHLMTSGVKMSISIKSYANGVITASVRCNNGCPVASKIATLFGGGGHDYASGFKIKDKEVNDIINECITTFEQLDSEDSNEAK